MTDPTPASGPARVPMLRTNKLCVGYGGQPVVRDVDLVVPENALVLLMGRNGAGKSTFVSGVSGLLPALAGTVEFRGERVDRLAPFRRARRGIAHVPQDRGLIPRLTVGDNLALAEIAKDRKVARDDVYELFPRLKDRHKQLAGSLSGGEQQMLGLGRALLSQPRLLILDEPSMGLSPRIAGEVFERIAETITRFTMSVLLVEQQISWVERLGLAQHVYLIDQGRIVADGGPDLLRADSVRSVYLGG